MQNGIPALPRTAIEKLNIENEANKLHARLNNALKWYLLIKLKTYVEIGQFIMPLCYNLFHICFLIWWHQVVLLHKYNSSNGTCVVGCRGVVQQGVQCIINTVYIRREISKAGT